MQLPVHDAWQARRARLRRAARGSRAGRGPARAPGPRGVPRVAVRNRCPRGVHIAPIVQSENTR